MEERMQVYPDSSGAYRWRLKDGNNAITATSNESFESKYNAQKAALQVRPDLEVELLDEE